MHWLAQAPANIALIKYMGKVDEASNVPANPSLSYTLPNLLSTVYLELLPLQKDIWEPLETPGSPPFVLSPTAQQRFIAHLARIKEHYGYRGHFLIRSTNNFPAASGLASSASSFAALTRCATRALSELTQSNLPSTDEQAALSRLGSGSSCRSFYAPWALWDKESLGAVDLPYTNLLHQVILISHVAKAVSSSEAHRRVTTSHAYTERPALAKEHLKLLLDALHRQDWASAYSLCWREFQGMHRLFASSKPPFTYCTDQSLRLLKNLQQFWDTQGDGPLVTMDAGPNIHLLYRPDQAGLAAQFKQQYCVGSVDVL